MKNLELLNSNSLRIAKNNIYLKFDKEIRPM